ncbi:MAG: class I SAM-dependent methyltransferase [Verrucomicrobia bacterium]|nr:class I SAM-dependent methyltransferase [Verrucomicrobiota bacterium]
MGLVTSFRDPGGFCCLWRERVLRAVGPGALAEVEAFLASDTARRLLAGRQLVPTRKLSAAELDELCGTDGFEAMVRGREVSALFEHERVEFPSFPHEWPPEMLHAAGVLTLELAQACLADGYGLKDATPANVLFQNSRPVFIDLLSFERRNPGDPVWKPHAQFCRTFLLPLLAHRAWGVGPADVFAQRRDGLQTQKVHRFCGPLQQFLPPFLTLVTLPTWLSRKAAGPSLYREHLLADAEKARFILDSLFRRLGRALRRLEPKPGRDSAWSDYMESHSYTEATFGAKESFVKAALEEFRPRRVLDVGANTGHFSALAAQAGARVVAIDNDAGCVGAVWRRAQQKDLAILPLVVDLARPSPAQGWRNRECPSFLERAAGAFDAVLMLALLHHLLVTERVPLDEVLDLAAELTTDLLIIEFVGPADEMLRTIARGRDHLHAGLTPAAFEAASKRRFHLVRSLPLEGTDRRLYLLRKKAGPEPSPRT